MLAVDTLMSFKCLLGYVTSKSWCYHHPLMHLKFCCKQRNSVLQSIENKPARISKRKFTPYRLFTLFTPQGLRWLHNWAYCFTSCSNHPRVHDTLFNYASIQTGALCDVMSGSCISAISVASKMGTRKAPQQCCPFRVLRTQSAAVNHKGSMPYSYGVD
jgi:hypothetical protein